MKMIGQDGEIKWDGEERGELCLRGPWIAGSYYKDERTEEINERRLAPYRRYCHG